MKPPIRCTVHGARCSAVRRHHTIPPRSMRTTSVCESGTVPCGKGTGGEGRGGVVVVVAVRGATCVELVRWQCVALSSWLAYL